MVFKAFGENNLNKEDITGHMAVNTYLFNLHTLVGTKVYADIYDQFVSYLKKKFKWSDKELDAKAKELKLKKTNGRYDSGELSREFGTLDFYYKILQQNIQFDEFVHNKVSEVLMYLKNNGMKIGVISNSMIKTIQLYIRTYRWVGFIDFTFSAEEADAKKNEDAFWKKLIEDEKLNPKECLVVGDDPVQDVRMPKRCGFRTMSVKKLEDLSKIIK